MTPRIVEIEEKTFVGTSVEMSYAENKTGLLWSTFMPRRNEIKNRLNPNELVSLQGTDPAILMSDFSFTNVFDKWALAEVSSFEKIPEGMKLFTLAAGKYAVFTHKGSGEDGFIKTLSFILGSWLPTSGFSLDNRPHFEVLGEKYHRTDPASEEDVWIPIK
ncbi:MAG: AraC family transcriptional regulator [Arcticibacterium sp.]|jgi:AraC family transcriptional regulator